jgi:hypothetical protein
MTDPSSHRLPCRFRNFELNRPLRLLLQHNCAGRHRLAVTHIPYSQPHQVTPPKLAVDGKVEQCELSSTAGELQANSDRPDFFQLEWGLLANELAFVPGLATRAYV